MSRIATILIPFSEKHSTIVKRAMASATAQTIFCDVIAEPSPGSPAPVRNLPLTRDIRTDFVVWLDADDYLEPDFVEQCLRAYEKGRYVYTGWIEGKAVKTPPAQAPFHNNHHLITTLYPTEVFKALGGFDATLPGYEDNDFYLRSIQRGICGVLVPKPLLHYTAAGQRSESFAALAEAARIRELVTARNGGVRTIMGCCGEPGVPFAGDPGAYHDGDVLAETLWSGLRSEVDLSRTRIIRGGNGQQVWVDRATAIAQPHKYRIVKDYRDLTPNKEQVLRDAGLA